MMTQILLILGGIGLYLYGMQVMTDALRGLASRGTRDLLARFTHSPLSGAVTGAVATALVQSSSATLLTAIGFVGAGLMTFPQAIGVIYGANIGTTVTGWMVMLVGFKLHLGLVALPLLFLGGLARIAGSGRVARLGLLAVGFSLLFLGLDYMQRGTEAIDMAPLFDRLPGDTLAGRAILVLIGAAFTVVVQASSAGVAMALVLIGTGALSLPQAAALVIGMDIGTTAKSVLATLGGSRDMRRTAIAHVVYNVVTGVAAFAVVGWAAPALGRLTGDDQAGLVAFHTLFNLLGVALMLPITPQFAALIARLVPDSGDGVAVRLDRALLSDAEAALDAAGGATRTMTVALFRALGARLSPAAGAVTLTEIAAPLAASTEQVAAFLTGIRTADGDPAPARRHAALLHQFDHLVRLAQRAGQDERLALALATPWLARPALALGAALRRAAADPQGPASHARLNRLSGLIGQRMARLRRTALLRDQSGPEPGQDVFALTDAIRWLERTARHAERIVHYATRAADPRPADTGRDIDLSAED